MKCSNKICSKCHQSKHLQEFGNRKASPDGKTYQCKACVKARNAAVYAKDPSIKKWKDIMKFYGITEEEYNDIYAYQEGICPICQKPLKLSECVVDHNHNAIKGEAHYVRGLLHRTCNIALGHLMDNPTWLRRAADYVEMTH